MFDTIIVLGKKLDENSIMLPQLEKRIEKAVEVYRKKSIEKIIMSGKYGYSLDYRPSKTEAQAMKEYAIELWVNEKDIYLEEKSQDTIWNVYFTRQMIEDTRSIVVITSDYHLVRVKYLFDKIFEDEFSINYIGTDTKLEKHEYQNKIQREKKIKRLTKKLFARMKKDETIDEFIKYYHPVYADSPKISKQELLKDLSKIE